MSLRTIPRGHWPGLNAMRLKVLTDVGFVEWLDPQAEMIQVACFFTGRCAASPAKLTLDRHQINQRLPSAQLYQSDVITVTLDCAAERIAIELKHPVEVAHAQHKMVDFAYPDHFLVSIKR